MNVCYTESVITTVTLVDVYHAYIVTSIKCILIIVTHCMY